MNKEKYLAAFAAARKGVAGFAKKAAPIYKLLNWKWSTLVGETYIPSEEQIRETTLVVLDSLESYGKAPARTGTGGIWVSVWDNSRDEDFEVVIGFQVADVWCWSNGTVVGD